MIDGRRLKVNDRVHNGSLLLLGTVDQATQHYVRVVWTGFKRSDIIARSSPLWDLLELVK